MMNKKKSKFVFSKLNEIQSKDEQEVFSTSAKSEFNGLHDTIFHF
jgi:hypothetical protein